MKKKDGTKRKMSRAKKFLIAAGTVLAVVLIAVFVFFVSPVFKIKSVEVPEFANCQREDILPYLEKYIGKNGFRTVISNSSATQSKSFFSLELVKTEEEIAFDFPYLENVCVKFGMDGTLTLSADERQESFLTEYMSTYLMCDTHGIVLATFSEENVPSGRPLVKGISLSGYKMGRSISDGKDKNTDTAIKICGLMSQLDMEGSIDIIDVSDYNDIYLFCAPSLTVKFGGTDNAGLKLSLLKEVIGKSIDGYSNGTLTVADGKQATFVKNGERED